MREILLWAHLDIMASAETILVIDGPMRYSCNLGQETFTITLGPCIDHDFGQYYAFAFQPMWCFHILADAMLLVIFVKSAEIHWLNVIGHLYMSGLAMLSEILTEWVEYKSGYNISYGLKFDILTADSESTCKTDPGSI